MCLSCSGRHATTSCFKLKNKGENNVSGFVGTKRAKMSDHWKFVIAIFVHGVSCTAVRDSGSAVSLVRRSLLAGQDFNFSGRMDIQGVFGEARSFPMAEVANRSPRF